MSRIMTMAKIFGLGWLILAGVVSGQDDIPLLRPEEREVVDGQSERFSRLIEPVLQEASQSTVRIWKGRDRLAYGTVIEDGTRVLTKWSEVDRGNGSLVVESAGGKVAAAAIARVYPDEDLAVLELDGVKLKPVVWSGAGARLGSFLAAPQPDGRLAGFGVLSVQERNLRETDKAFLGVVGAIGFEGRGVKISEVSKSSGAADAGLMAGDVILQLDERPISGLMELQNAMSPKQPGAKIQLRIRRGDEEMSVGVLLGNRPHFPNYLGSRLAQMERMGTRLNRVRDSFSSAIQTDMNIAPNQVGGPVVNLKGQVIGITLARADRTRSFVMSASAVEGLLKQVGQDPVLAKVERDEARAKELASMPERPSAPKRQVSPDQLQNHVEQMRRLMDFMQREMDALEGR